MGCFAISKDHADPFHRRAVLWLWVGAAYHLAFFVQINPAALGFGALSIVGGLLFIWQGVIRRNRPVHLAGPCQKYLGCPSVKLMASTLMKGTVTKQGQPS